MTIASPCVQVCSIDQGSGLCHGCGRTIDEIMGWAVYTPERRAEVSAELPARMDALPTKERRVTKRRQRQRVRAERPADA